MKKLSLLFVFSLLVTHASAQIEEAIERFQFDPEVSYNSNITSPAEYLGYELGEEYTFIIR